MRNSDQNRSSNKRLEKEIALRQKAEEKLKEQQSIMDSLHRITLGLLDQRKLEDLLEDIVKGAAQIAETPDGYMSLLDPESNTMMMEIGIGIYKDYRIYHLNQDSGFGGKVWRTGKALVLEDYSRWPERLEDPFWNVLKAVVGVPLKRKNTVTGILVLTSSEDDKYFNKTQCLQLSRFAELASIALENARLYNALEVELEERIRADKKAHLLHERLKAIIENARDHIYVKDAKLRYMDANPAMSSFFGCTDITGKTDEQMFNKDFAQKTKKSDMTVLKGCDVEEELEVNLGNEAHILHSIKVPLYDKDSKLIGICGYARDMTQVKKNEKDIFIAREALERAEKFASLGAITANISHEINQPLNAIKVDLSGMLYWHNKGVHKGTPELMGDIKTILRQVDKIEETIAHIRSFVGILNKTNVFKPVMPCNVAKAIQAAMVTLARHSEKHKIHVRFSKKRSVERALGTELGIEKIVTNLLQNAIESLASSESDDRKITVKLHDDGLAGHVIVDIRNNGPSIAKDDKSKLFDPFFTTKDKEGGMGLGLSIVQALVSAYGGRIECHSSPKRGTAFRVILQAEEPGNIL